MPPESPRKPPAPEPSGAAPTADGSQEPTTTVEALPPPILENPDPFGTLYIEIEEVVREVTVETIPNVFSDLKEKLATLKGARSEQGKRVLRAVERTEELFLHLIQVRHKMQGREGEK